MRITGDGASERRGGILMSPQALQRQSHAFPYLGIDAGPLDGLFEPMQSAGPISVPQPSCAEERGDIEGKPAFSNQPLETLFCQRPIAFADRDEATEDGSPWWFMSGFGGAVE